MLGGCCGVHCGEPLYLIKEQTREASLFLPVCWTGLNFCFKNNTNHGRCLLLLFLRGNASVRIAFSCSSWLGLCMHLGESGLIQIGECEWVLVCQMYCWDRRMDDKRETCRQEKQEGCRQQSDFQETCQEHWVQSLVELRWWNYSWLQSKPCMHELRCLYLLGRQVAKCSLWPQKKQVGILDH